MDPRRSTIAGAQGYQQSGIPQSSSRPARPSMAPGLSSSNLRQSLAPARSLGASRASTAHGSSSQPLVAPSTVGRGSNMYQSAGSASVGRTSTLGRVEPGSVRRASTYRQSTMGAASTPSGGAYLQGAPRAMKDPRNSKDPALRRRWAEQIANFLNSNNYNPYTDVKVLAAPTAPQFNAIFKFLILILEPSYKFGQSRPAAEEVPLALKTVCYPFRDSISKSHLQQIGSQQSWPNMLAMLHWLVELIENRTSAFQAMPQLHVPMPYEPQDPPADVESAWREYTAAVYVKFLADEDFNAENEPELSDFKAMEAFVQTELQGNIKKLVTECAKLRIESEALTKTPDPLIAATERTDAVRRDTVKMKNWIEQQEKELAKNQAKLKNLKDQLSEANQYREENAIRLKALKLQVQAQGLTPVEVQSLTTDNTNLAANLTAISVRKRELLQVNLNTEVELQRAQTKAETLCDQANKKMEALGLLPESPAGYEHINFRQEVDGASEAIENLVTDCLIEIRPALLNLKVKARLDYGDKMEDIIALEEKISRERDIVTDKEEMDKLLDREHYEKKVGLAERTTELKEQETLQDVELEQAQARVKDLTRTAGKALAEAEQRLDYRTTEQANFTSEAADFRERNRNALSTAISSVLAYKEDMITQTTILLDLAL